MSRIFFLPVFITACSASSAAQQPKTPDFHDYVDLDRFCADAGFGFSALGYRQEKPWVDQVLCLSADGIRQVNATKNGVTVDSILLNATGCEEGIFWVDSAAHNGHIALDDGLLDGCSDKRRPIAVLAEDADVYFTGATIHRGSLLCMVGDDLVLYDGSRYAKADNETRRWRDFTPTLPYGK